MDETRDNVVDLGRRPLDSREASPEHILRTALEDVRQGVREEEKMLILFLDDTPGKFAIRYYQSGMRKDECASLCNTGNALFLKELGL